MPTVAANGITIAYEEAGRRGDPVLLLVHGLGAQLTLWPDAFVEELAAKGFHVIRYDNRDVGLSTKFESYGVPDLGALIQKAMAGEKIPAPYLLTDMARDGIGLLDALKIDRAHVVGASMGGMIVQTMAIHHPERLRSMTSIFSTTGRRGLPTGKPEVMRALLERPQSEDREVVVQHSIRLREMIGSPGYPTPPAELRAIVERNVDRAYYPQGVARQYNAVMASGSRVKELPGVRVPTLVIHGKDDPLVPAAGGEDTAALIPGATLKLIDGMGHDIPPGLVAILAEDIAAHARKAG